ncbi:hypothetical protein, partial [Klebsiella oxytoca]|uniref:hypothetical protein n=1 Tax=Klebsiella oxytoca TaxID=571 RepID=UPI001954E720
LVLIEFTERKDLWAEWSGAADRPGLMVSPPVPRHEMPIKPAASAVAANPTGSSGVNWLSE